MAVLRAWRVQDATDLARALNNPMVQDNLRDGLPFPYTVRDAKAFIHSMLQADPDMVFAWAITQGDVAVGSIGLFRQQNVHRRTAEMGYYVSEACWGKGIGTQAVREACGYVFAHTDILRIYAEPYAHNAASCRILEKSGFTLEGVMRKNAVKHGEVLDMKLYALVKE